jgi:hypothetical protein
MDKEKRKTSNNFRRASSYLNRANLELVDGLPQTAAEFYEFWKSSPHYRKTAGFWAFCRHACTNYDQVIDLVGKKFKVKPAIEDRKVIHDKARKLVSQHLSRIGFLRYVPKGDKWVAILWNPETGLRF